MVRRGRKQKVKTCKKCGLSSDDPTLFKRNKRMRDGYENVCNVCHVAYVKAKRQDNRAFINALKEGKPCVDCGGVFPVVAMDFDHLDPALKSTNIARLTRSVVSQAAILAEMALCELVCANCHRVRTAKSKQTWQPDRGKIVARVRPVKTRAEAA